MGSRSNAETLAAIFVAFTRQPTWSQAELARELGISSRQVRDRIEELHQAGIQFERQEERPHVYWSVPKGWFPGGLLLTAKDSLKLLRHIVRAPRSNPT